MSVTTCLKVIIPIVIFITVNSSEPCTKARRIAKQYAIFYSNKIPTHIYYLCRNDDQHCKDGGSRRESFNNIEEGTTFRLKTSNEKINRTITYNTFGSISGYLYEFNVTVEGNTITLPNNFSCVYSKNYCYDTDRGAYAVWESHLCKKKTIYKGTVDEWTIKDNPPVKFITFSYQGANFYLQIIGENNNNCYTQRTDQDNVIVSDMVKHTSTPNGDVNLTKFFTPLNVSDMASLFCEIDQIEELKYFTLLGVILIVFLIACLCLKSICNVISNCCLLRKIGGGKCFECFSQNLTYERAIFQLGQSKEMKTVPDKVVDNDIYGTYVL